MLRLPDGWSLVERVEDAVCASGLEIRRAGLFATRDGVHALGAAAAIDRAPIERAEYELVERVAVLEAIRAGRTDLFPVSPSPDQWVYAKTNGVALHDSFEAASERAFWELVERDAVVRSWHGETRPNVISERESADDALRALPTHRWRAAVFETPSLWSRGVSVIGVFGFPIDSEMPFVVGYGARATFADAHRAACAEALQSLAFLWGEPKTTSAQPPGPMLHLENLQRPGQDERIRDWLEQGHGRFAQAARTDASANVSFVDLTPAWLCEGRVVKAVCAAALPLAFGQTPASAHLPPELRLHPVA
jgi:hypothetical protein